MKKTTLILSLIGFAIFAMVALAGDLEPTGPPASSMHTLEDIYNQNNNIYDALANGFGGLAPVEKTGQTASYATGDDGDLEPGVAWPNPRFTDNGDGTVTDNLTGLVWLKNATAFGLRSWSNALTDCNTLNSGEHGLTDGSVEGDWRLPSRNELFSLADASNFNPVLPTGHPFTGVLTPYYWTSTTCPFDTSTAWYVTMSYGDIDTRNKNLTSYVWPVRNAN